MGDWVDKRINRFEDDVDSMVEVFRHAQNCSECKPMPIYLCPEALSIGGEVAQRFYEEAKIDQLSASQLNN